MASGGYRPSIGLFQGDAEGHAISHSFEGLYQKFKSEWVAKDFYFEPHLALFEELTQAYFKPYLQSDTSQQNFANSLQCSRLIFGKHTAHS